MNDIKNAKRIVFKVGTSTLTYENGKMNLRRMAKLCSVLADLSNSGREILLVSSGAIAIGLGKLGMIGKPQDTADRQAVACVGQCELMFMYDKFFSEYNLPIGQLLMTKTDVENEKRHKNLVNSFNKMLSLGIIPIINENDSVCIDEIAYGDNDYLSAVVAVLVNADALVMLTDKDGLFTSNPETDPDATLVTSVPEITDDIYAIAGGEGTWRGTGGMATKIKGAQLATSHGIETFIINGSSPTDIYKLLDGRIIGTRFAGRTE